MTLHNREVDEIVKKYSKEYEIESEPENYIHVGLNNAEFASHLKKDLKELVTQAEARGAAKLAEELLGSECMEEMKIYEDGGFLAHRNEGNMIANLAINAIKEKIKELCPTTTPSST